MTNTQFEVRPITEIHKYSLDVFSSGEEKLDTYLQKYAKDNHKKGIGKTFVLINNEEHALGYYTISMASIEFSKLPKDLQRGIPRYPIPAARIGRLAVDLKYQGQKLGESLLFHALKRIYETSQYIAAFAIIVDAKNEKVKSFYEKYGFTSCSDEPLALLLPMTTIEKLIAKL
jgi:ribosomal protein S18 acetylase RimI-like enzyme